MDWLDEFRATLVALDERISEFRASSPSAEEACTALSEMHRIKTEVGLLYDTMADIASDAIGENDKVVIEGAVIEKKISADRKKWQHKDLGVAVAKRIVDLSVDMETGEIILSPADMVTKMLDYCAPSYWRVSALKTIGVNPDLYCETGDPKTSIIVRRND